MMDVLAISNLLQDCSTGDHTSIENDAKVEPSSILTPASFGSCMANKNCIGVENKDSNEIWSSEEVPTLASAYEDQNDDRSEPTYQLYFKQEVGTEDIFLGTDKSPGSFDCSHVVVKVHFPGASIDELNLDVRSNSLLVESFNKYVNLKAAFIQ